MPAYDVGMKTILIAEDDEFIRLFLERKLATRYHIVTASTVSAAWDVLRTRPVDLILLDVLLPDMNGFAFLEECKRQRAYKDIPVIIISNLGQPDEIGRGLRLGATEYLIKSNVSPAEIAARVEAVLGSDGRPQR